MTGFEVIKSVMCKRLHAICSISITRDSAMKAPFFYSLRCTFLHLVLIGRCVVRR